MDLTVFNEEKRTALETLTFLRNEIAKEAAALEVRRSDMMEVNKQMWTEYSDTRLTDREKQGDASTYLSRLNLTARAAERSSELLAKYGALLHSPYFARIDFLEDGTTDAEKIYIGTANLVDLKNHRVYVYDWRSPVAGIYYRFEAGRAFYSAPLGTIEGEVLLKRQLVFKNGELRHCADTSLHINDEILLEALSKSSGDKMRTIVETIQKEQNLIIRNTEAKALIVNGAAGSGKTSIALHRVAYLLYEKEKTGLNSANVLILSPSSEFENYVGEVLPGLGEEKAATLTIDDLYGRHIRGIRLEEKNDYLESLALGAAPDMGFKSSPAMAAVLDRLAVYYERRLHKFSDIFLDGTLLFDRVSLKHLFLENNAGLSAKARLLRIRGKVRSAAEPVFERLRQKIKDVIVEKALDKWAFEVDKRTDALLAKIKDEFNKKLKMQTSINILGLYRTLLTDKKLFARLSKGFDLPENAGDVFKESRSRMREKVLPFPDQGAVFYLSSILLGFKDYESFRHVVIDEAQDIGLINYLTFRRLFKNARFTILGDELQNIGGMGAGRHFKGIEEAISLPSLYVELKKSYRQSKEIQNFSSRILNLTDTQAFERSGPLPQILTGSEERLIDFINHENHENHEKNGVTAVLTKTRAEADRIRGMFGPGVKVMPIYLAKGLEFDTVIIYGADGKRFNTAYDRRLLYVGCTRALHRLILCAEGEISRFINIYKTDLVSCVNLV